MKIPPFLFDYRYVALFWLSLLTFSTASEASLHTYQLDAPKSHLQFEVDSTLHLVHGTAHEMIGSIDYDPETGSVETPMIIQIPVLSLDTENTRRDKAMYEMFSQIKYPFIEWRAVALDCPPLEKNSSCHASGMLTIGRVTKESSFDIELRPEGKNIRARGHLSVQARAFGLKPPSVLGIIRVADEVRIRFDTVWNSSET